MPDNQQSKIKARLKLTIASLMPIINTMKIRAKLTLQKIQKGQPVIGL
jgi:hypothetical protein